MDEQSQPEHNCDGGRKAVMARAVIPALWKRNSVGLHHRFGVNCPLSNQDGFGQFFR